MRILLTGSNRGSGTCYCFGNWRVKRGKHDGKRFESVCSVSVFYSGSIFGSSVMFRTKAVYSILAGAAVMLCIGCMQLKTFCEMASGDFMDSEGKRIIFGFFGSIVSDCGGSKTVSAVH